MKPLQCLIGLVGALALFVLPATRAPGSRRARNVGWQTVWTAGRRGDRGAVVAFSPDGSRIVSGTTNLNLMRASDGKVFQELRTHLAGGNGILSVAFSPGGHYIAASGSAGPGWLWDVRSGRLVRTIADAAPPWYPVRVAFSSDGAMLATTGKGSRRLWIWNVANGALERVIPMGASGGWPLAFAPAGDAVASADDSGIRIWHARDGAPIQTVPAPGREVTTLAFSHGGRLLAAGTESTVRLYSVGNYSPVRVLRLRRGWLPTGIAFAPHDRSLAVSEDDPQSLTMGSLAIWRVADGRLTADVAPVAHGDSRVWSVAFSPKDRLIAYGLGGPVVAARWR